MIKTDEDIKKVIATITVQVKFNCSRCLHFVVKVFLFLAFLRQSMDHDYLIF